MLTADSFVVVEPHADDAFLSLGGHIVRWVQAGSRVEIVTVFSGTPDRGDEARRYAEHVGASWRGLGWTESSCGKNGDPGRTSLDLADVADNDGIQVWPLGLDHPEHRLVAAQAPPEAYRYLEVPYQLTLREQANIDSALAGRTIESWLRPPRRKYLAASIFRTQSLFFIYNPPKALAAAVEVIVS